ncbi:MAG: phage tail sheath C-terminal domain-containing protein [Bacteroidota bacterium]
MPTYKTPNVYVEEISKFPPSVAPVATAVPAFIGYTEKAIKNGKPVAGQAVRIRSLLEYEEIFGFGPSPLGINVSLNPDNTVASASVSPDFYLYDSMRMFYLNGGGNCYIVSVGDYPSHTGNNKQQQDFIDGVDALVKEDESTMILFPDAVFLSDAELGTVQAYALSQCKSLKDRVAVMDVKLTDPVNTDVLTAAGTFRNNIGVLNMDYGAAYVPYIETTLPYAYRYADINLSKGAVNNTTDVLRAVSPDTSILDALVAVNSDYTTLLTPLSQDPTSLFPAPFNAAPYDVPVAEGFALIPEPGTKAELIEKARYIRAMLESYLALSSTLTDTNAVTGASDERTLAQLHTDAVDPAGSTAFETYLQTLLAYDDGYATIIGGGSTPLGEIAATDFNAANAFEDYTAVPAPAIVTTGLYDGANTSERVASARPFFQALFEGALTLISSIYETAKVRSLSLEQLLSETNPVYSDVVKAIDAEGIVLPPSGAIVGVYATVDRDRGVYKAPANVSLIGVSGPTQKIDNNQQDDLNVDVSAGKSINAIRSFTGKGTLVWGARTLAGNSNEWRYISVRRFFVFAEESIKKATEPFVFEPNDANTWSKVKSMITNFLTIQWRDGALQGAKPEQAFYVQIGLGETMTAQDILEGRMIVEIGMAVVRPAEFIILRFAHKLPEA